MSNVDRPQEYLAFALEIYYLHFGLQYICISTRSMNLKMTLFDSTIANQMSQLLIQSNSQNQTLLSTMKCPREGHIPPVVSMHLVNMFLFHCCTQPYSCHASPQLTWPWGVVNFVICFHVLPHVWRPKYINHFVRACYQVCGSYVVIFHDWTPIFEWEMARACTYEQTTIRAFLH